jgi:hypothetical protein
LRLRYAFGSLLGAVLVLALAATARPAGPLPRLEGPALAGPTHLHLVVSAAPPYIYDVDANTVRAVSTAGGPLDSWVRPSGNGAFVARYDCCTTTNVASRINEDGSVQRLATGSSLAPASDSPATWVLRRTSPGHCRLALVPGGRSPVRAPCRPLLGAGEAGVLMWTSNAQVLVDARTGRVRARAMRIVPLHGDLVLEETGFDGSIDPNRISLVDLASGTRRHLRWPSILRRGLDEVVAEPHGSLVAVGFGDPAYPGPAQASDVWILDTATGKYTHLPGFPAQVRLKFSSIAWTSDDRLVLLLEGGGRTVLAVWRPGSPTLPLRPVELPAHTGGSDTFVPLVGP